MTATARLSTQFQPRADFDFFIKQKADAARRFFNNLGLNINNFMGITGTIVGSELRAAFATVGMLKRGKIRLPKHKKEQQRLEQQQERSLIENRLRQQLSAQNSSSERAYALLLRMRNTDHQTYGFVSPIERNAWDKHHRRRRRRFL